MSSIHGITCSMVKGEIPGKKLRVRTWTVPGINGLGAQVLGYGDAAFEVLAVKYGTAVMTISQQLTEVSMWVGQIEAAQGTLGTIVTDLSSYADCLITRVGPPRVTRCEPYGYRVEMQIAGERK